METNDLKPALLCVKSISSQRGRNDPRKEIKHTAVSQRDRERDNERRTERDRDRQRQTDGETERLAERDR